MKLIKNMSLGKAFSGNVFLNKVLPAIAAISMSLTSVSSAVHAAPTFKKGFGIYTTQVSAPYIYRPLLYRNYSWSNYNTFYNTLYNPFYNTLYNTLNNPFTAPAAVTSNYWLEDPLLKTAYVYPHRQFNEADMHLIQTQSAQRIPDARELNLDKGDETLVGKIAPQKRDD